MATVINPALPYKAPLAGKCLIGTIIQVKGTINSDGNNFAINLITADGDKPLHFNPRFGSGVVVMNTYKSKEWGAEERVPCCDLQVGQPFDLTILVESDKFMVGLNGHHYCHFAHRLKAKSVTELQVKGDADITLIREATAFTSSAPIINPTVPYTAHIQGGFTAEKILLVYGVATGDQFSINLQDGHEPWKSVGLHLNPRVSQGSIILNDVTNGSWGPEQVQAFALHQGWAFAIEIVCHADSFDIHVNGTDVGHFEHRNTHVRALHQLDTLFICGDVQIHQLRI